MSEGEAEAFCPGEFGAFDEGTHRAGDGEIAHELAIDHGVEVFGVWKDGIDRLCHSADGGLEEREAVWIGLWLAGGFGAAECLGDGEFLWFSGVFEADAAIDCLGVHLAEDEEDHPVADSYQHC